MKYDIRATIGRSESVRLTTLLAVLLTLGAIGCSGGGGNIKDGLAGKWTVIRTVVTEVPGLKPGYYDTSTWTFVVNGNDAELKTDAGSIKGSFTGTSWVFSGQGTHPQTGQGISVKVEIIGVDPLKGTNEITFYDPYGYRPPSTEAFVIEGSRAD